jgi:hypothetical protein
MKKQEFKKVLQESISINSPMSLNQIFNDLDAVIQAAIEEERGKKTIKAKALRKKGTGEWYWPGIGKSWDMLPFPNNQSITDTMDEIDEYYSGNVPTDAELIDITIIVNEP